MNEIQLFSLRRTIILSLVLGLFTMAIVGQALDTGNPEDGSLDDQPNSSTTSSTTSTTATSTATQTETQSGTQQETNTQPTYAGDMTIREQDITEDAAADFDSSGISNIGDSFNAIFSFSLQFLLTSSLFFGVLAAFYILAFNNNELKDYINQSLAQAGFPAKISSFGKHWVIKGKDMKFNMNIIGFRNLRMKIELPKDTDIDPREFGLRRLENSAITYCDLEVLPMRLQVVKMYLTTLG
ncbi:MAG: hypothetical protein GPJ54_17480 [Candidatus Heimdallarchaeota archaeon]|nr:hypothetical protein [Candidatus Heimdallarchaeota archaeon]